MEAKKRKTPPKEEAHTLEDLTRCTYLHLSTVLDGLPYGVPVRHLLLGKTVYFHGGDNGKLDGLLSGNPEICLSAVLEQQLEETDHCLSLVTIQAFGTVEEVVKPEEYRQALFGLYVSHANPDNKEEAWIFSRNETWTVYKMKIDSLRSF